MKKMREKMRSIWSLFKKDNLVEDEESMIKKMVKNGVLRLKFKGEVKGLRLSLRSRLTL
jgi:hypothetical protein